jgi:SAM-dependent methyltransferase
MNDLPFSLACERNKVPILAVLRDALAGCRNLLEIGSGTGQHAVHFAAALAPLRWQPTELAGHLVPLLARIAAEGPANCAAPVALDVRAATWPVDATDAVFSANTLHIMSWAAVTDLFAGVGRVLVPRGRLCIYGPFSYAGRFTAPSNAAFDLSLREHDPASGIRDFEAVESLAVAQGLELVADYAMPANNQLLIWSRTDN